MPKDLQCARTSVACNSAATKRPSYSQNAWLHSCVGDHHALYGSQVDRHVDHHAVQVLVLERLDKGGLTQPGAARRVPQREGARGKALGGG